jgi:valyl-tRNA synthetase
MDDKFLKPYNPKEVEQRIYQQWEDSGYFNPDNLPNQSGEPFSIVLPPPNVTGTLHIGHALMLVIQDIMIRFNRMRGKRALWLPGTDHAAIATQSKVEDIIFKKEGKTRHDFPRDEFIKQVEDFAQDSHDIITNQVRRLGSSVDWSREAYTLDEKRAFGVRYAFKKMYEDGLIFRGDRIVNWDPKLKTTVSDEEIEHKEETGKFYYLHYGPFVIGTARPETKFGDKYVVMHPDDKRYEKYTHGDTFELEWINGTITATIIKDASADPEFGTGVMTITPWHDLVDFDLAEKYNLEKEQVIDQGGFLLPIAGEFAGQHIKKARPLIVEKLQSKGLVDHIDENYVHNIGTNSRGGGIIEPQIMRQWFVDVNKEFNIKNSKIDGIANGKEVTLKELMLHVVEQNQIEILPDNFRKIYTHWINNLHDWCISRQIWYGHQIPVWYKGNEVYCGTEAPIGDGWEQDPDTLDTWFSSGLWTFSTLGWPEETVDLKTFHPTSVLETGYDILFFWVARMILMGTYFMGEIPFKTVYLHGLIRDAKGRKMSKSVGNIIDPLDMIEKYGTDAVRLSLIVGNTPGTDMKLSEDRIRGYKHFANKIWNVTRFILENTKDFDHKANLVDIANPNQITKMYPEHLAHLEGLRNTITDITEDIEKFRFYLASEKIYHYFWHTFADEILEWSKPLLRSTQPTEVWVTKHLLLIILADTIKILHPFMPFVTEEIWTSIPDHLKKQKLLMVEEWPL